MRNPGITYVRPPVSEEGIQRARAALTRAGFESHLADNGHLLVKDPYREARTRRLGYETVTVRSYGDAIRFILARCEPGYFV